MMSKGQLKRIGGENVVGQAKFIKNLFGVNA
jgi:hypothetical protein